MKTLIDFDFCLLCGKVVFPNEWRNHMIWHNSVLKENPRNKNGSWKNFEKLEVQSLGNKK